MPERFQNELDWRALALAFTIWSAHFMSAWAISSIFPGQPIVFWLTLALTLFAFAALLLLWLRQGKPRLRSFAGLAIAMATVAVAFDFLPSLMA